MPSVTHPVCLGPEVSGSELQEALSGKGVVRAIHGDRRCAPSGRFRRAWRSGRTRRSGREGAATLELANSDNDPHGARDFGAFDLWGERVMWKIDYYHPEWGGIFRSAVERGADPPGANLDASARILGQGGRRLATASSSRTISLGGGGVAPALPALAQPLRDLL